MLFLGTREEAGSQLLPHLGSGIRSCAYNNGRVKQLPHIVQKSVEEPVQEDSAEEPVQEDSPLVEDKQTESSATEHASSSGNKSDLQNACREPTADIGDTEVERREPSEMCDTGSHQGNSNKKLLPDVSYMIATNAWEYLPNAECRLCASTNEHPKQSIVGWLRLLNEVIPNLVSYVLLLIILPFLEFTDVCKGEKVNQSHYRPEVPIGFQEVKVPKLRDIGPEWW